MSARAPIYVVSGLPRSGTSMMMRMLEAGGLETLADHVRRADEDNPRGYYELEEVKQTARDSSWVARAEGRVVKVISQLLPELPRDRHYKVVFMRRNLDEVLRSQRAMLARRGERDDVADGEMKQTFVAHLEAIEALLRSADHMQAVFVSYNRLVESPRTQIERVANALAVALDREAMAAVVEPALYRQRTRS